MTGPSVRVGTARCAMAGCIATPVIASAANRGKWLVIWIRKGAGVRLPDACAFERRRVAFFDRQVDGTVGSKSFEHAAGREFDPLEDLSLSVHDVVDLAGPQLR